LNDDGDNLSNVLTGGTTADVLNGLGGNDTLTGGGANDSLTGGTQQDRFVFNSPSEGLDTITDFNVLDDTIAVSLTGFGAGLVAGTLLASRFVVGTSATTSNHRFVYNSSTGGLFFDADGVGSVAPIQLATLTRNLPMTNADFLVF
jgi:Ca2+-binding RTX toxin-like protein